MTRLLRMFVAAVALTAFGAQAEPVNVKLLDLFVDPPTGFVFVKMPGGWKFVGQLDAQSLSKLPAGVHTALLQADELEARVSEQKLGQP